MKTILGVSAGIIGALMVVGGILAAGVFILLFSSIPGAGIGYPAVIGLLVVLLGLVLCRLSWALLRSAGGEDRNVPDTPKKRPLGERFCPNCGCQPVAGSKTCEWCGANLK